jgi:hypothetical protein
MTQLQSQAHSPRQRRSSQDIWLQWPDTYRPACPLCATATIGLMDRGHYLQGGLRLRTIAEPCGCDVSEHAQAIQAAAVQAGAIT